MSTTPNESAPNLDAICALCGKTSEKHGGQHARCPNDTDEHYWHPTNRFTPAQPDARAVWAKPNPNKWKLHFPNLLREILKNAGTGILHIPLDILRRMMLAVAERASEINDEKLNQLMCGLALYEISDPEDKEHYDSDRALNPGGVDAVHCVNTLPIVTEALEKLLHNVSNIEVIGEWEGLDINYKSRREFRPKIDAVIEQARAALSAARDGSEAKRCPKCGSAELSRGHQPGSFALPECDFDRCNECGHQFNQ